MSCKTGPVSLLSAHPKSVADSIKAFITINKSPVLAI